jgi:hypothetical protein
MTGDLRSLADLQRIAALVSDQRLGALAAATARCEATRAAIEALAAVNSGAAQGNDPVQSARVALLHAAWADQRRAILNVQLARQRAERAALIEAARTALGRAEALRRLVDMQGAAEAAERARRRRARQLS